MKKIHTIAAIALTAFLTDRESFAAERQKQKEEKTNFIIILCDDMGYGDISCFGNPTIKTPNIDRMACDGMKMTQFYTGSPTSTPSRSALLTGRLSVRNGMYGDTNNVLFPDSKAGLGQDEITLAKILKEGGYSTGCIGKWHLGCFSPYLPTDHGFDFYFGFPYSNDMGQKKSGRAKNYPELPLMLGTKVIEENPDQGQITKRYTEQATKFIRENAQKPFFLYLAHAFPHVPLFTNDRFRGKSERGLYGDVVEELDWSVGEIMKVLVENGIDEKTIVIFSSDNGPWLQMKENGGSAGPLKEGKGTWCEGGFRVPTIIRMPGKIKPSINHQIMRMMDIFPTFLSMAHIQKPDNLVLDGLDQSPMLLSGKPTASDEVFYWWGSELMAVRKGNWKYYFKVLIDQYLQTRKIIVSENPLLYNLGEDPSEKFNLAAEHPDIILNLIKVAENHKNNMKIKPSVCDLR